MWREVRCVARSWYLHGSAAERGTVNSFRLIGLAATCVAWIGTAACAQRDQVGLPEDPGPPGGAAGEEREAESAPLVASLQAFAEGNGMRFVLQVTNAGGGPIEMTFLSGQTYDFAVFREEEEIWRWSGDQMFTQAVREERIDAGETWSFEELWSPEPGLRGELSVLGTLTSSDRPAEQATRFSLP
jgi:hypothetical protein